jgi:hypothetical protein
MDGRYANWLGGDTPEGVYAAEPLVNLVPTRRTKGHQFQRLITDSCSPSTDTPLRSREWSIAV